MAWARVDDQWWSHPKVLGCSLAARGLWVTALTWACGQRTSYVPASFLELVAPDEWPHVSRELVEAGIWVSDQSGFQIVGWTGFFRPGQRSHIPAAIRRAVYERDGYACVNCGSPDQLTIDHINPRALGGTDREDNLQTLCITCNSRKGDAPVWDDSWRG